MGIVSEILANGARKPIFGYHAMVLAMAAIAFLGYRLYRQYGIDIEKFTIVYLDRLFQARQA
jgi:heme/copper-type cytochrome/quinol oxidase subunit 1